MARALAEQTNQTMVDRLIAEGALWSAPVIAAFRATPRHQFIDRVYQYHRRSGRWRQSSAVPPSKRGYVFIPRGCRWDRVRDGPRLIAAHGRRLSITP